MDKKNTITQIFTDFSEESHDSLFKICFCHTYDELYMKYGCVYLSYVLESTAFKKNIQLATDQEWGKFYFQKGLSKTCHIAKLCRKMNSKQRSYTINWNLILPDDTESKKTHILRQDFGFDNGITYATVLHNKFFGSFLELINIVGDHLDLSFYKEICQNKNIVKTSLLKLRTNGYNALCNKLISMVSSYKYL